MSHMNFLESPTHLPCRADEADSLVNDPPLTVPRCAAKLRTVHQAHQALAASSRRKKHSLPRGLCEVSTVSARIHGKGESFGTFAFEAHTCMGWVMIRCEPPFLLTLLHDCGYACMLVQLRGADHLGASVRT